MNPLVVLRDPTRRWAIMYGQTVSAHQAFHEFLRVLRQEDLECTVNESSRTVRFPQGGFVKFVVTAQEFTGLEFDRCWVNDAVKWRRPSQVELLQTRVRPRSNN